MNVSENIIMICEEDIVEKVSIIQRQTDYTKELAREKLLEKNMNHLSVIKEFLGIPEKKPEPIKSVQQAIYKQLRIQMNDSIKDFNTKQDDKLISEIADKKLL